MTEPRPTVDQWQAIRELTKHLSVSAGAGAGKTWVLTERYTAMLAGHPLVLPPLEREAEAQADTGVEPSVPQQIVAITFTKEAAGEMKARIRERLGKWKDTASDDEQRRIAQLKEEVERATITTIHGYCSQLLREYPLEAGVDPQFRVLEESDATFWLDEALREVLDEGLGNGDQAVIRLVTEYAYEPLVQHLARFYPGVREQTENFPSIAVQTVAKFEELSTQVAGEVERLRHILENIAAIDLSKKDTSKGSAKKAFVWQQTWPQLSNVLTAWEADGYPYREEILAMLDDLTAGWGVLIKELKADVPVLKEQALRLAALLVPDDMKQAVRDVCDMLDRVHRIYSEKKAKARALDFTDLQNSAVRLLQEPAVKAWQAKRLRFLMVDEFQDTNPVQKSLLDALSDGNDNLKLFVVGDAKQSIYRFRGADLEVFLQTQEQVKEQQGEHISLMENFRTQQPIIDFINRLFDRLMPTKPDGLGYVTTYEPMKPTRTPAHDGAMVEILHLQPEEGSDSAQDRLREAEAIAERIREMVGREDLVPSGNGLRKVEYRDIALLFSAMTHVSLYEYALQKHGIPYYIIGSRQFFTRQEVYDLTQLLQTLVDERDPLPLIGALRSPLFGVSDEAIYWLGVEGLLSTDWRETPNWPRIAADDQEKLLRAAQLLHAWRQEKAFKSAGDLLASILERTGYEQALLLSFGGRQKVGNVRKLLDLAYGQPAERASVGAFLQELNRRIEDGVDEADAQVESDQSDVVKIMTVHKSKGLEFPVVILPDMAREVNTRTDGKFQYAKEFGLAVSFAENEAWNELGFAKDMREQDKQKAKEEERRKLYVAMTRARDYLMLVGTRKEPKNPVTLDGSSWWDWMVAAIAEGQLSQMEANLAAEWPEVAWRSNAAGEAEEGVEQREEEATRKVAIFAPQQAFEKGLASANDREAASLHTYFPLLGPLKPQQEKIPGLLLSVSALMTYMTCPRQYFYKYEWKLPERMGLSSSSELAKEGEDASASLDVVTEKWEYAPDEDFAGNGALEQADVTLDPRERGTLVHRVLELLRDPSEADELIRRALAERRHLGDEAERWVPALREDVQSYLHSDLFREVQAAVEQHSELKFRLAIGRHELTGIIDKIIRRADGQAVVIDYKTNRISQAGVARTTQHYTPQLQLYTRVAQQLLHYSVERAALYFTVPGVESQVPIGEPDLLAFEERVQAACDHIATHDQAGDFPLADEESPCRHCGYLLVCKGVTRL